MLHVHLVLVQLSLHLVYLLTIVILKTLVIHLVLILISKVSRVKALHVLLVVGLVGHLLSLHGVLRIAVHLDLGLLGHAHHIGLLVGMHALWRVKVIGVHLLLVLIRLSLLLHHVALHVHLWLLHLLILVVQDLVKMWLVEIVTLL